MFDCDVPLLPYPSFQPQVWRKAGPSTLQFLVWAIPNHPQAAGQDTVWNQPLRLPPSSWFNTDAFDRAAIWLPRRSCWPLILHVFLCGAADDLVQVWGHK